VKVEAFQAHVMKATGFTSEYLSGFIEFSRPMVSEMENVEKTVGKIRKLELRTHGNVCHVCSGTREFSAQGLASHMKAKHGLQVHVRDAGEVVAALENVGVDQPPGHAARERDVDAVAEEVRAVHQFF